ncbi:hypothetical protein G7Y89_g10229 [Cudoniella acicularis]|uniref:Uncharacterized protein n=1 Tax=Cudoniella acicularis TaxID=354080 RepID=A0A8H4RGV9_9HELO|nr:hypothetical protein G7Y89_g10229 [Cudoniella acicularis]
MPSICTVTLLLPCGLIRSYDYHLIKIRSSILKISLFSSRTSSRRGDNAFLAFLATVFVFAEAAPALVAATNPAFSNELANRGGNVNDTIVDIAIPHELVARACQTGCAVTVDGTDMTTNCLTSTSPSVGAFFNDAGTTYSYGGVILKNVNSVPTGGFASLQLTDSTLTAGQNIEITVNNDFTPDCSLEMNLNRVTLNAGGSIFLIVGPVSS